MGMNACIYCKTTDGEKPALCDKLPEGADIIDVGEWYPDGATHEIDQCWRYYGPGYARGPWPIISATLMALYSCENVAEVWYFGDGSSIESKFTKDQVHEYNTYYMENGDRPYRKS